MLNIKHITQHSETTICFYFSDSIQTEMALEIAQFAELILNQLNGLTEVIPSYTTLFIEFNLLKTDAFQIKKTLCDILSNFTCSPNSSSHLELPIYYHPDVAPDLTKLAAKNNLTIDDVVQIHSDAIYTVTSLGFAPGFAYLAGLDPRLATARLSSAKKVAKGSLGIADNQTGIYPRSSPGGWSIIGNCPVPLVNLSTDPITPFEIGMTVKFRPITQNEFLAKGGVL